MKILSALKRFVPLWRRPVFTPNHSPKVHQDEVDRALDRALDSTPMYNREVAKPAKSLGLLCPPDSLPIIEPPAEACHKCGGIFREEKLTSVFQIEVPSSPTTDMPFVTATYFCVNCQPVAPLVLILKTDGDDDVLDSLYLKTEDGWFQRVDEDSGEGTYFVSSEEYASLYCDDCGELLNRDQTTCASCRRKEKKS